MKGTWIRKPSISASVVFIHGFLSGDDCWLHKNGSFWPEMLKKQSGFEDLGIYSFTYLTDIFSGNYKLSDIVSSLKEHLTLDNVTNCQDLIFVCHSMGGIVARKYIVQRAQDLIDLKINIGLFLLASPSLGSDYANWLRPLAKLLGNSQAEVLRFSKDNDWLNDLNTEFKDLKESKRINIIGKELIEHEFVVLKKFWRKQVVEPIAGACYFGESYMVPKSDHFSIAKPESLNSIQHRLLCSFITNVLQDSYESKNHSKNELTVTNEQKHISETLIKRLVDEYTISKVGTQVPFGGRDSEMKYLNEWVSGKDTSQHLLILAPAGRGKTALLINWSKNLISVCIFAPISIRVGTNSESQFLAMFSHALGFKLNKPPVNNPSNPMEGYRSQIPTQIIELGKIDKDFVIIIDGIDEATGWQFDHTLIPYLLPKNVKIIVSARVHVGEIGSENWMIRLGWNQLPYPAKSMNLEILDINKINHLVSKIVIPLATECTNQEIIETIYSLSEGEPVLIRYFIEDLIDQIEQKGVINLDTLKNQKSGFAGYFQMWMNQQIKIWEKEGVEINNTTLNYLLAALATALGPLSHRDLHLLFEEIQKVDPILNAYSLNPLRRFVMGAGTEDFGYILQHPKLSEFISDELLKNGPIIDQVEQAFVDWGKKTIGAINNGEMKGKKAPKYLLHFLRQHFENNREDCNQLMSLVTIPWVKIWKDHIDAHTIFSTDLRKTIKYINNDFENTSLRVSWRLKCQLMLTSVDSQNKWTAELIAAAYKHRIISYKNVLYKIDFLPTTHRSEAFASLLPYVKNKRFSITLNQAINSFKTISNKQIKKGLYKNFDIRVKTIVKIIPFLQDLDYRIEMEEKLLEILTQSPQLASWLDGFELAMPCITGHRRNHMIEWALAQVESKHDWDNLLSLMPHLSANECKLVLQMALDIQIMVENIINSNGYLTGNALIFLFPYYSDDIRIKIWPILLDAARSCNEDWVQSQGLTNVYPYVPDALKDEIANEILVVSKKPNTKNLVAYSLASAAMVINGAKGQTLRKSAINYCLGAGENSEEQSAGWAKHAVSLISEDNIEYCLSILMSWQDPEDRGKALSLISDKFSKEQLIKALDSQNYIGDSQEQSISIIALSSQLSKPKQEKYLKKHFKILKNKMPSNQLEHIAEEYFYPLMGDELNLYIEDLEIDSQIGRKCLTTLEEIESDGLTVEEYLESCTNTSGHYTNVKRVLESIHLIESHNQPKYLESVLKSFQLTKDEDITSNFVSQIVSILPAEIEHGILESICSREECNSRIDLLTKIMILTPLIKKHDGEEGINLLINAIHDISKYWP